LSELRTGLKAAAALVLLDASVTFSNWWPTPGVWWSGAPSIEVAVLLLALVLFGAWRTARIRTPASSLSSSSSPSSSPSSSASLSPSAARPPARLVGWLSAAWVLLIIGRYVDVTAPALWGRELNFYWDLRFLPDVAAMLVSASSRAVLIGAAASVAIAVVLWVVFIAVRWSFSQLLRALADVRLRWIATALSSAAIVLFAMQSAGMFGVDLLGEPWRLFPRPVTQVYARQARLVYQAVSRSAELPPSPPLDASLARVEGADVFLVFLESYGAITYDNASFDAQLRSSRQLLADAVRATGRQVVSAFIESPTFGGSSWFAHISFLSGIRVADPDTNALLMTEHRPTVVTNFAARGYRTLAVMPGLWYPWPEGAFYGFQDLYNGPRLNYQGPSFGWWDMPDQFTLARLDEQELSRQSRKPVFVFYPTVTTHAPFSPVAPYQPDWSKMLTTQPFSAEELDRAYVGEPDYMNLAPYYVNAVAYTYRMLAGYVRERAGHDYVMILMGDHQPPALVTGEHASWDVPVHIIASRPGILDPLRAHGFADGLIPHRPHLGQMHELVPIVLDAFSGAPAQDAAMHAR
jgi:hypothetical protein